MSMYKGENKILNSISTVSEDNMRAIAKEEDKVVYTTDETVIGTWVDGKPLYRKVLYARGVNIANETTKVLDTTLNTSYISGIIRMNGGFFGTNGAFYTMPYNGGTNFSRLYINETGLCIQSKFGGTIGAYNFIIEYTKTTD